MSRNHFLIFFVDIFVYKCLYMLYSNKSILVLVLFEIKEGYHSVGCCDYKRMHIPCYFYCK